MKNATSGSEIAFRWKPPKLHGRTGGKRKHSQWGSRYKNVFDKWINDNWQIYLRWFRKIRGISNGGGHVFSIGTNDIQLKLSFQRRFEGLQIMKVLLASQVLEV